MPRKRTGSVEFRGTPPRWFARLTVKDEHGVTHRPWVDLQRPDLKDTPADRAVAQRLALKRATDAKRMVFVGKDRASAPRVTVESLEQKWFALLDEDPHLKSGTRTAYKSCFTARIKLAFGKRALADLNVPMLRAWIREMAAEVSPSTVRNNAIAFTRFIADARAEGWAALDSNPMKHEDVRAMLPTVEAPDREEIVQWTKSECEALLSLPTLPDDRFGLYLVALLTGLRAGELRGLTFAHVDTDGGIVRVRQQRGLARAAGESTANGTPKTRSSKRDVPLHQAARTWLAWWRDEGWSLRFGRKRSDEDAVFPAVDGEPGRPRDANILRRDLTAARLPVDFVTPEGEKIPFTFHATRRTFSRLLSDAGAPVEVIGMLAGHAGATITERHYMGRSLEAMARAVALIRLALPERRGVAMEAKDRDARGNESSPQSSRPSEAPLPTATEGAVIAAVSQLQPIELPQFRHL